MGLFDRFKRQRDPDELLEEIGQHLIEQAPSGFSTLWARCFIVNGSADVALFVQASEGKATVEPLALTAGQEQELKARFTELWQVCKSAEPEPWSSAALTISGEGDMDAGFSHEAVDSARLDELKRKWEDKFLPGNPAPARGSAVQPVVNDALKDDLETAFSELKARNEAADQVFNLRQSSWSLDQTTCAIRFHNPDGTAASAPFQTIGTLNRNDGTWLWAWDNPSIVDAIRQHALTVRAYGEEHGHELLTERKFPCDEELAWRLTALAAKLGNAQGAYRAPAGPTLLFLTIGKLTLATE